MRNADDLFRSAGSLREHIARKRWGEAGDCPQAFVADKETPSAGKPDASPKNERRDHRCAINPTSGRLYRKNAPQSARKVYLRR
jgi:hypothetical protein